VTSGVTKSVKPLSKCIKQVWKSLPVKDSKSKWWRWRESNPYHKSISIQATIYLAQVLLDSQCLLRMPSLSA